MKVAMKVEWDISSISSIYGNSVRSTRITH
nr:MAG TPA: hypothetical protein [Caudoviricetes sp.]